MAPVPAPPVHRTSSTSSTNTSSFGGKRPEDEELKPYVIVGDLGKGSFATVYKGYNQETRREVAIKTVSRSGLSSKLFENLQSEIDILKSLQHRHITRLIDVFRAERNIYLIMEYCAGGDLTNYIKKRGRVEGLEYVPHPGAPPQYFPQPRTGGLTEIVVRSFLRQLARALKFLRQRNLIHRDIKPQNLLLKPPAEDDLARGHPLGIPILKIADFGFARLLPEQMMAETLCGSPLYMAPEILSYQKYDAKADLWSVGAVLYEMSVGKPPFRAQNHIELLKKIDHSKGIKFPDEDPRNQAVLAPAPSSLPNAATTTTAATASTGNGETQVQVVPDDVKKLIRVLLKRNPVERASFDEFFKSNALANSKFPRPGKEGSHAQGRSAERTVSMSRPGYGYPDSHSQRRLSHYDREIDVEPLRRRSGAGAEADGAGEGKGEGNGEEHEHEGGEDVRIPPEVLDANAMIPPSRFKFRRRESAVGAVVGSPGALAGIVGGIGIGNEVNGNGRGSPGAGMEGGVGATPPNDPTPLKLARKSSPKSNPNPGHAHDPNPKKPPRALEAEASLIPGETEEDGLLRREYVLVGDVRAVEFNRAVDEINSRRRPLLDVRAQPTPLRQTPSRQIPQDYFTSSSPPLSSSPTAYTYAQQTQTPYTPYPQTPTINNNNPTTPTHAHTTTTNATFPPPPNLHAIPPPSMTPGLSSASPGGGGNTVSRATTNALARALSLASKKLFGQAARPSAAVPHFRDYPSPVGGAGMGIDVDRDGGEGAGAGGDGGVVSSRRPIIVSRGTANYPTGDDPDGDGDGGRKVGSGENADVGGGVGVDPMEDELLERLEQLAQKTDVITRWADEMYEYVKAIPQKPLPDPAKFTPREGEPTKTAIKRRHADFQAEYNAVTCVAVYMLVMSFSQKGIEELSRYQQHCVMREPDEDFEASEGFDEALTWFMEHFEKCSERAVMVKTWLPAQYTGPSTYVDELVYNRALTLSRTAAKKELLDQHATPDECEMLYVESLWCLYALQDDLLQKDNPFMEEDRETISTWIKRTKLRLIRCRARKTMNNRDRLKDARADKNLDDVPRIPAPWDAEGLLELQKKAAAGEGSPTKQS